MEKITQTAGRNQLGEFAPDFAHYNDDVLFGENWNNHDIDLKTRCIITVVALMSSGITDSSLTYHLENAKAHGVTRAEIVAIVTHVGFYVGWPKAWAVFRLAKDVWNEAEPELTDKDKYQNTILFPIGAPNDGFKQYFSGQSYLAPYQRNRSASSTLRLSRAAATTGTSTTPKKAAGKFSSASAVAGITRSGAKKRSK